MEYNKFAEDQIPGIVLDKVNLIVCCLNVTVIETNQVPFISFP